MHRILLLLLLLLTLGLTLNTQDTALTNPVPQPTSVNVPPPPQETAGANAPVNAPPFDENLLPTKTRIELWLSIAVLLFGGLVTLGLIYFLAQRTKGGSVEDLIDALKYPIVVVIIVGGLFLVTAGYGNEQIAPIIGLMGTIAGYLMGRSKGG